METLEDAVKHGFKIQREVRYFAVSPNGGPMYALRHDWTTEQFDRTFVEERLNALEAKYEATNE